MMAIDFLIFAVLLVSFVINFLALAAFWVTPGLRTTANRFTINLVIINLVGCVILAPTLFLSGAGGIGDSDSIVLDDSTTITTGSIESGLRFLAPSTDDDSIEFYSKPGNHQMTIRHNGRLVEQEGIILTRNISLPQGPGQEDTPRTIETIYKCNKTFCRELTIDEGVETLVITEIQEETDNTEFDTQNFHHPSQLTMRSWSVDMAAALGAMAVLLVVGDTWCAVTDPLRYHSRISGVKSWILIASTWAMGILFGALSALREIDFESDMVISKQKRYIAESTTFFTLNSANNIFSVVFSCIYFVLIILLPFGFVCGMYWRIFSEARENGLRMRQNGSSPLLQSALNLNQGQQVGLQHYSNSLCAHRNSVSSTSSHGGGLQMQIDQQQKRSSPACPRRDSAAKVLLPPISDDGLSECDVDASVNEIPATQLQAQQPSTLPVQQNIILTLQTASGEIKRNYSTRQLELLASSSQELCGTHGATGMRQVRSTPNLQRSLTLPQPLTADSASPHLLGGHLAQNLPSIHMLRHTFQQNNHHARISSAALGNHHSHHPHNHQSLQIPTIHGSPKALSYMSSLRHRLSNASSLFKYRDESRAARISILVVIMFLVSYLPYGFLVVLQSRIPSANFLGSQQLAIFMILLANLSSPFIFAYRNKRVRRGVKRLVGLDALCGDAQLKRHSGSNSRLSNSKCGSNLKRNSSRVSTYSTNSGRYLTPQSSLASNGVGHCNNNHNHNNNNNNNNNTVPLRPNSSCSTIINFNITQSSEKSFDEEDQHRKDFNKRVRPLLQRGITIIDHVPLNGSIAQKTPVTKKLCKLFFKNSKNYGCASRQLSTQSTLDSEPTEV